MSAPYIIPFNFQPVSTVASSSGTYTVPAGKYARVTISNAILPVLNSVNLFKNKNLYGNKNQSLSAATVFNLVSTNVHRINFTMNGSTSTFVGIGSLATITNSIYDYTFTTSGSWTFTTPSDTTAITMLNTINVLIALSVDTCDIQEIWLKAGDVLTYSDGSIVYSEFNIIS